MKRFRVMSEYRGKRYLEVSAEDPGHAIELLENSHEDCIIDIYESDEIVWETFEEV